MVITIHNRAELMVLSMLDDSRRTTRPVRYDPTLSVKVIEKMLRKQRTCEICGRTWVADGHGKGQPGLTPVIDQIQWDGGHVTGNVCIICQSCNKKKGRYGPKYAYKAWAGCCPCERRSWFKALWSLYKKYNIKQVRGDSA